MKKRLLFVVLAACAIALLAMVGVAGADGGPHGGYTPTTDGCAGCHRAHTADAPSLLTVPVAQLCMSCHAAGTTGADTNVDLGIYMNRDSGGTLGDVGVGLKGGGFSEAIMDTSFAGSAAPSGTTSAHTHDGTPGILWGNGAVDSGAGPAYNLECTDCHDPHGNGNYRILRAIPNESGGAGAVVNDVAADYTVTDAAGQYFGEGYNLAGPSNAPMTDEYQELSDWCTQCHTRYLAGSNSGHTPLDDGGAPATVDSIFTYRHMAGGDSWADGSSLCGTCHANGQPPTLPTTTYNPVYWNHDVECMTCHVSHGTSAVMVTTDGPYSGTVEWPDDPTTTVTGDARSSLLRVDNRGVCQACHNKSPAP